MTKRRDILKAAAAVGASAAVWQTPVIQSVILPAHAVTTEEQAEICTDLLRIEIQLGYTEDGSNPAITELTVSPCEDPTYVTAWGYYKDAPTTPVYINTRVLWTTSDSNIAFIGSGPGILPQDNSFITGRQPGQATFNATLFDLCAGFEGIVENAVTAELDVTVANDVC